VFDYLLKGRLIQYRLKIFRLTKKITRKLVARIAVSFYNKPIKPIPYLRTKVSKISYKIETIIYVF